MQSPSSRQVSSGRSQPASPRHAPRPCNVRAATCPPLSFSRLSLDPPQLVFAAIQRCDIDIRANLWGNIVLSGGGSLLPGLTERLSSDLHALAPSSMRIKVIAPPERKYAAWIGGSTIGALSAHKTVYGISRAEYAEHGPSLVHTKCAEGGYMCYTQSVAGAAARAMPTPSPPVAALPAEPMAPAAAQTERACAAAPPKPQSNEVALTQPKADTNCVLLQVGQLIAAATTAASRGELCTDAPPLPVVDSMPWVVARAPTVAHYLLSAAPPAATDAELPPAPMVVFCMDVSGSMGATCKSSGGVGGRGATRLECMQQALIEQIGALEKQQPGCVVALVTFSSRVWIHTDGGKAIAAEPHELRSLQAAVATGAALREHVALPVGESARTLREAAAKLTSGGATSLGPALALSIGVASAAGSRVVIFTDGLANTGIGQMNGGASSAGVPFYTEVGELAAAAGVSVSVLSLEGEDCAMEQLGTTADLTGGAVDVVDPLEMTSKVQSLMRYRTLATGVECALHLPPGMYAHANATGGATGTATGAATGTATGAATGAATGTATGAATGDDTNVHDVLHLATANATEATEMSVRLGCDPALVPARAEPAVDPRSIEADAWEMVGELEPASAAKAVATKTVLEAAAPPPPPPVELLPVEMRLTYTLPTGERVLTIATRGVEVTDERAKAEGSLHGMTAALAAIHHAAALAQAGSYLHARAQLIGTQRLLQRGMADSADALANQQAYLSFIVQAEKLDGFMRERQAAELIFGGGGGGCARDDEAAKAMYQMKSVTSRAFHAR